jgi:hypothetical protein
MISRRWKVFDEVEKSISHSKRRDPTYLILLPVIRCQGLARTGVLG